MSTADSLSFNPDLREFYAEREGKPYTALAGANNSGKSVILKSLRHRFGRSSYMIGTNRFYHVYHFSTGLRDTNELDQLESQFQSNFFNDQFNYEQNFLDLNRVILNLSDLQRSQLFGLCELLTGNHFELRKVDPDNDLSMRYIDMDGQNMSLGSTGTRLLMTMLGICMDQRFSAVLIDEPELGLGPRIQSSFSEFLQNGSERRKYFPHLENVYVATHSHLFLNRSDLGSNFIVTKKGQQISCESLKSVSEFHKLQFNLLGNTLESLFLPAAIVVVEGKTDRGYVERLMQLKFPKRNIVVISGQGDVKKRVASLRDTIGGLDVSPFQSRLFVVLDLVHNQSLSAELVAMGVLAGNIIVWARNGIEYYYPAEILAQVFRCRDEDVDGLVVSDDRISLNGITKTKSELSDLVAGRLSATTELPREVEAFIEKIQSEI